jgi:serine/threonine protein kinase
LLYKGEPAGGLDDLVIKVGDFGLSILKSDEQKREVIGTYYYLAPEVALKRAKHSPASDVYSFGLLLWEFVMRVDIYSSYTTHDLARNVFDRGVREPLPERSWLLAQAGYCPSHAPGSTAQWPDALSALIDAMWSGDVSRRPSMEQVGMRLRDIIVEMTLPDPVSRAFWIGDDVVTAGLDRYTVSGSAQCLQLLHRLLDYLKVPAERQRRSVGLLFALMSERDAHGQHVRLSLIRFGKTIAALGPLPAPGELGAVDAFFARIESLLAKPYFHGICATDIARRSLTNEPAHGRFLVRLSNRRTGCFALSRLAQRGDAAANRLQVRHTTIHHDSQAANYWLEASHRQPASDTADALDELIDACLQSHQLLEPAANAYPFSHLFKPATASSDSARIDYDYDGAYDEAISPRPLQASSSTANQS